MLCHLEKDNNIEVPVNLKFINFFAMTFVTCLLASNILAPIPIEFIGLVLPGGSFLFPISFLLDNIITEVYGYKYSRSIIWYAIICHGIMAFFFTLTGIMPLKLPISEAEFFKKVLFFSPIVFSASLVSILVSQHLNSMVLSKMKRNRAFNNSLFSRCITSTFVGVTVDSLIFIPIVFFQTVNYKVIFHIIVSLYIVKISYEFIFYPVTMHLVNYLKKKENINVIDFYTKYTPFSLDTNYTLKELAGHFSK